MRFGRLDVRTTGQTASMRFLGINTASTLASGENLHAAALLELGKRLCGLVDKPVLRHEFRIQNHGAIITVEISRLCERT